MKGAHWGGPFKPDFGLSGAAGGRVAHSSRFWLEWGGVQLKAA